MKYEQFYEGKKSIIKSKIDFAKKFNRSEF